MNEMNTDSYFFPRESEIIMPIPPVITEINIKGEDATSPYVEGLANSP